MALATLGTGEAAIWAAAIAAVGGIVTASLAAATTLIKESRTFQRELINRLLTREESVLSPLVSSSENMQGAIKTIGTGVSELLIAQKIEDGQRRHEGGD